MSLFLSVLLLSIATAMTCALPGTFLVLKRQSMLVDAMSHAVLPGIVIGAIVSGSTHSILMTVFATLMGLVVIVGAEFLGRTGLISGDANQGLIFPLLFAIGVLLLSTVLSNVHICEDTVLTGDLNLNALREQHLLYGGYSFGPAAMWRLAIVFVVNTLFITIAYRTLKTSTFDPNYARTIGLPVQLVDWALMTLVSLTIVVAFDTAGAILVVALMIVPAASAHLLTHQLKTLILLTQAIAIFDAILGFYAAYHFDLPTSAMMAVVEGTTFLIILGGKSIKVSTLKAASLTRFPYNIESTT